MKLIASFLMMPRALLSDVCDDLFFALTGESPSIKPDLTHVDLKQRIVRHAAQQPIDTLVTATLGGSVLYYLAEREKNPRVKSFADAFWVVSSCIAAVSDAGGATTPFGKYLLGVVMGIGPGMQAMVGAEGIANRQTLPPASALDPVVVQRLDHISALLEKIVETQSQPR